MNNWYWIELIGFDVTEPDFGVGEFLRRTGKAEGVSLLFSSIDFVNEHVSSEKVLPLPLYNSSYASHRFSEEREIQQWTNIQLKSLVQTLQNNGVKVLFAVFNMFCSAKDFVGLDSESLPSELADKVSFANVHKELWNLDKEAMPCDNINILKRFRSGAFYEDFFLEKVLQALCHYGFDGIQLADGISSSRPSIQNGDFSDDLVGQFLEYSNCLNILPVCQSIKEYKERRELILKNHLFEWLKFSVARWEIFYQKAYYKLKNYIIWANCAWTCDPFEAYYRYGIDYTRVFNDRLSAIMFEDVSPTMPIYSFSDSGNVIMAKEDKIFSHNRYFLAQAETRLATPVNQITMTSVRDTQEQWDILRHAPMELVKSVIQRNCLFVRDGENLQRVSDGELYCLSDSFYKNDWDFIYKWVNCGRVLPSGTKGIAVLCTYSRLENMVEEYVNTKNYSNNAIVKNLLNGGITCGEFVSATALSSCKLPLLVINPRFLTKLELDAVKSYRHGIVAVSSCNSDLSLLTCCKTVFSNAALSVASDRGSFFSDSKVIPAEGGEDDFGGIWTAKLKYNQIDSSFFANLAQWINNNYNIPCAIGGIDGQPFIRILESDSYDYVFIFNSQSNYLIANIDLKKAVLTAQSITKYAGYQVNINDSSITTRVPPRGTDIIKVMYVR